MEIKQLTEKDCSAFKKIRLEALEALPEAFGSSFEDEKVQPDSFFIERLQNGFVMAATQDDEICAIVGFYKNKGQNRKHIGGIWTVYTKPKYRQRGLSKRLFEELFKNIPTDIELLHLGVGVQNEKAIKLYKYFGFEKYGIEEKAIKTGNKYYDEILMVKFLR